LKNIKKNGGNNRGQSFVHTIREPVKPRTALMRTLNNCEYIVKTWGM
jgi:hypothetical protein